MNGHLWELVVTGEVLEHTHYLRPREFVGQPVIQDTFYCSMCGTYWNTTRCGSEEPKLPSPFPGCNYRTCQEIRDSLILDVMDP